MKIFRPISFLFLALFAVCGSARDFNDKLMNRPYADSRRFHLGFSVGTFVSGMNLIHNGLVSETDGSQWRVEQPGYQPGFCVNGLADFRLSTYFSLRVSPGMYFGTRDLRFLDLTTGDTERQGVKSTFIVLPVDLKAAAMRYRNVRPYVVGGVMPAFDVSKRGRDLIALKNSDIYINLGFGCDFYLPYFKFIPELKFCLGLTDVLKHDRPDLADDPASQRFTASLKRVTSKMVVLTFYFE
ncbi:MAG: outer membrane beta-barrel protein [Muribaculaceae bacterium]|nr:outer membrane beta-barrel protein [Muribaculaceae bacterium]